MNNTTMYIVINYLRTFQYVTYVGTTLKMKMRFMVKLKEFLKVHVNIQAENFYHTLYFSTLSQGGFCPVTHR
jgi:hypothetical protein